MILKTAVQKQKITNVKQTLNMAFPKGNKVGNRFKNGESGNPDGRPLGALNRATIPKQLLAMKGLYPDAVFDILKKTYPELEKDMTVEQMLYVTQLDKAIKEKDTAAANFIVTSAHGQAKQELEIDNKHSIHITIE